MRPRSAFLIMVPLSLAIGTAYVLLRGATPEIPAIDTTGVETNVSAKISSLRQRVREHPRSAATWGRLGKTFHAHGFNAAALRCYLRASELEPEDYRWPYLAALASKADDPSRALAFLQSAVALKPAYPAVYITQGELQLANGQTPEARQSFDKALALDPDSVHARYGLAEILALEGRWREAIAPLQRIVSTAHHHGESHAMLAQIYRHLGEEQQAREHELLGRAFWIPTRPDDPILDSMEAEAVDSQSLAQRGARLVNRGDYAAAEALFRQVLEIGAANPVDYTNLGTALAGQGRYEDALAQYERALALDPDHVKTVNNIAIALVNLNRLEEARAHLRRALAIDESDAETHYNLGRVEALSGKPADAERHYRKGLELNPAYAAALEHLGDALAAQGQFDEAVASWRRALLIHPGNIPLRYHVARQLIGHGRHEDAIDTLRAGLKLAPDAGHLSSLLAWELATAPVEPLRDPDTSLALSRDLYRRFPDDAAVNEVLAASLAATGDFEGAGRHVLKRLRLERVDPADMSHPAVKRLMSYRRGEPYRQPAEGELP